MIKKYLITIFKLLLIASIFYWLISSGKLDFSLITKVLDSPLRLTASFLMAILIFLIMSYRYLLIIKMRSQKVKFTSIFKYNWIAQFFNAVLPGSVTGDLIKVFYLNKEDKLLSKSFLVGSIVIDRLTGLFGLIINLGIFSLINYRTLSSLSNDVKTILNINLVLVSLLFVGLFILFKFEKLPLRLFSHLKAASVLKKLTNKLETLWLTLASFKKNFISLLFLSISVQILAVCLFWFITSPYSSDHFDITFAFSLIPIGFIALALPIAPSGLGVGHAIFHSLFLLIGIKNGASLFNIYFLIMMLTNITGVIPYLLLKRKH